MYDISEDGKVADTHFGEVRFGGCGQNMLDVEAVYQLQEHPPTLGVGM